MDLTGKKAEQAAEGVQNISQRLEQLESHLNAVDDAVQDNQNKIQNISAIEDKVENLRSQLGSYFTNYHNRINTLEDAKDSMQQDVDSNSDRLSGLEQMNIKLEDRLDEIEDKVKRNEESLEDLKTKVDGLKEDIDNLDARSEQEGVSEFKEQLGQKLDRTRFTNRQRAVNHEINKLRTSINALADSIDENDKIEVDE
ncbi:MAG: chromosome segregation ATPase [Candidatus Nanohaloarchaea archaeon]|jgi:chromosome segregation ATPase